MKKFLTIQTNLGTAVLFVAAFFISLATFAQRPNFILILTDDQGWTSTLQLMDDNVPNSKSDYFETPELKKIELYNLKDDLGELNDLAKKYPQKVKELEMLIFDYAKEVNAGDLLTGTSEKKNEKENED